MPRFVKENTEAVNPDSFLDIVASVVSIMIIMVVMEGSRIKNAPVQAAIRGDPLTAELEKDAREEQSLEGDILNSAEEIERLNREAATRSVQRDMLATTVSALEQKIESHRRQLDEQKRQRFDLARSLSESRFELDELAKARQQAETAESAPIVLENYPTPISRAVDSNEAHFQLSGGSIIHIPLQELLDQFQTDAQRKVYKLRELPEITETIGPVDGFRLKYTLERHDMTPEEVKATGRMGSYVELKKWTLIPVVDALGEPSEAALGEGSAFRKALSKLRPGQHTVTIWTYEDSFDAFRQIRKELYRLGFTTAARPLPLGRPITGSPEGSKSAAQ
ncbi:MAG: hypothetical protein ABSA16_16890 [Thermoguttaceae bacterium]|jgi:hypothetical protein